MYYPDAHSMLFGRRLSATSSSAPSSLTSTATARPTSNPTRATRSTTPSTSDVRLPAPDNPSPLGLRAAPDLHRVPVGQVACLHLSARLLLPAASRMRVWLVWLPIHETWPATAAHMWRP